MNFKRLKQSFKDAGRGMKYVYQHEQNFRLQILLGLVVLIISLILEIARSEFIVVMFLVFLVLGLELLNTVLEKFLDLLKPRLLYQVKTLKDIMAAMVLLASFASGVIGLVIFLPYLIELLFK